MENSEELAKFLLQNDHFSQWLGIEIIEVKEKYCLLKMPIRKEMINSLKTVHGGVTFAFADSALGFSSNNTNDASVALNCVISFTKAVRENDVLFAESILFSDTNKTAVYDITIKNQRSENVAAFRGTVYKLGKKVTDL